MVKTLHLQWRGTQVLFLVWEMRSHLPCGQNYKHNKPYHLLTWRRRRTFIEMEEPRYRQIRWSKISHLGVSGRIRKGCWTCPELRGVGHEHCSPPASSLSMEFSRQEYWSGLLFPSPKMSVSEHPLPRRQWLGKGGHRELAADPSLCIFSGLLGLMGPCPGPGPHCHFPRISQKLLCVE